MKPGISGKCEVSGTGVAGKLPATSTVCVTHPYAMRYRRRSRWVPIAVPTDRERYMARNQERYLRVLDAAKVAGVSDDTIRRRLADGSFPRAEREPGGGRRAAWLIPTRDLVAAGFDVNLARLDDDADDLGPVSALDADEVVALRVENARLHTEVRHLSERLADRDRTIETLQSALQAALEVAKNREQGS